MGLAICLWQKPFVNIAEFIGVFSVKIPLYRIESFVEEMSLNRTMPYCLNGGILQSVFAQFYGYEAA